MKLVVDANGTSYSLEAAAKMRRDLQWICAKCGEPVEIPLTRKKPRLLHEKAGCDGVLVADNIVKASLRAAAFIAQHWRIFVENRVDAKGVQDTGAPIPITIERVKAFATWGLSVPVVLVQSYNTAFIIGFCASEDAAKELKDLALSLGCGALGYVASDDITWAELADAMLNEAAGHSQWLVLTGLGRQLKKRKFFDQLAAQSLLPAMVRENRTAVHYDPTLPQSRAHYLQDVLADLCAQGWAKWVRALILSRGWRQPWPENFEARPIQVPYFWLRYWLIKRSLVSRGQVIDVELLALELAASWRAQEYANVIEALSDAFSDTLSQLSQRGLVEKVGTRYRCKKSLRRS